MGDERAEALRKLEERLGEASQRAERLMREAAQGLAVFRAKPCIGCHTISGISEGNVGPNLTHVQSRTTFAGAIFPMTPQNLAAWLRDPPGEKPGSRMPNLHLTEDEIAKLVAYLETLK